jgi:hypothetical protein
MSRAVSADWAKTQTDSRGLPVYGISEAAHYLPVPRSTLHAWVSRQTHQTTGTTRLFKPIINLSVRCRTLRGFSYLLPVSLLRRAL